MGALWAPLGPLRVSFQDIVRIEKYRIIAPQILNKWVEKYRTIAPQILRLLSTVVQVRTALLLRVERRDPTTVLEPVALHSFVFRGCSESNPDIHTSTRAWSFLSTNNR